MVDLANELELPIRVFGAETHITYIVSLALGAIEEDEKSFQNEKETLMNRNLSFDNLLSFSKVDYEKLENKKEESEEIDEENTLFSQNTVSIVYGMQMQAVQGMLDFDSICKRKKRSVAAIVYPFGGNHFQKFYYGTSEILIPCYESMDEACERHKDATVCINFASLRSVFSSTKHILENISQIKTIAIIAEGVPENHT
jgi:ATP citrate (pro-S)-lyase